MTRFVPQNIANTLSNKGCVCISFPSIYFAAYFPNAISSADARQEFDERLPVEAFPNWTLSRKFMNIVDRIVKRQSTMTKEMETFLSLTYLTANELDAWALRTFVSLRKREEENNVTIPLSDWFQENWKRKRLMHITNHPTKIVFHHLINEIIPILQHSNFIPPAMLSTIAVTQPDTMEKCGAVPILPCVRHHFQLTDESFGSTIWVHGRKFGDWEEYIHHYVYARDSK